MLTNRCLHNINYRGFRKDLFWNTSCFQMRYFEKGVTIYSGRCMSTNRCLHDVTYLSLSAQFHCRNEQTGFLFHFKKRGHSTTTLKFSYSLDHPPRRNRQAWTFIFQTSPIYPMSPTSYLNPFYLFSFWHCPFSKNFFITWVICQLDFYWKSNKKY